MVSQSWDRDTAQEAVELPLSLRVFPMPRTVLVVDDERDTNDILANLVQARGLEPVQVFSGQQGLAAVAEATPDLILLDLMLPDIDGFEFCDRLKRAGDESYSDRDGDGIAGCTPSGDRRARRSQRLSDQAVHTRAAI